MGNHKDLDKEDPNKLKTLGEQKRFASLFAASPPLMHARTLAKVSNSRTQLFILFMLIFLLVNHVEWFSHPTSTMISNIRMGVFALNLLVIYFGVLFLPETTKSRPFGLFWKLVQAMTMAYSMNVFFLLFFSKDNLQIVLRDIFDSNLGKPLPEKNYAADCRLWTPEHPTSYFGNITDHVDIFVLAHFLGWAFKVWIFRNSTLAWIMSLGFEVMEFTFEVWLPNFKECWWDHFGLDVFGCNLIGMLIGFYTMKKFKMRRLNWFMAASDKTEGLSKWGKVKSMFLLREDHIKNDKWHWLSEMWTFNGVICFCFTNLALDLSYFFMKSQIEIPPPHWLFAIRIWVLAFFSILAANDYYDYVVERRCNSMTLPLYLIYFVIGIEWMMFYKNLKPGLFNNPVYSSVRIFWSIMLGLFLLTHAFFIYEKMTRKDRIPRKVSFKTSLQVAPTEGASSEALLHK